MDTLKIAKDLYTTYSDGVGGIAFNGDKLPTADDFFEDESKKKQQEGWIATANSIGGKLLSATQNLGHPAYNMSSGTTEAIDSLRNSLFDYLGVPEK